MTLTPREREVAELVAKGLTRKQIASELGVSPETVKAHIADAARRIGGDTPPKHRLLVWFYSLSDPDAAA